MQLNCFYTSQNVSNNGKKHMILIYCKFNKMPLLLPVYTGHHWKSQTKKQQQ